VVSILEKKLKTMTPNQISKLKTLAKILAIIISVYFIVYHTLFVVISFLSIILLGVLLVIFLPKIGDGLEDFIDNFKK
jgi:hypothetical protein